MIEPISGMVLVDVVHPVLAPQRTTDRGRIGRSRSAEVRLMVGSSGKHRHTMVKKLRSLAPIVRARDTNTVRLPPKQAEAHYVSVEHRAWAKAVLARAGWRCEAVDVSGMRCIRAYPEHRMFADHIHELKDNGPRLDVANGMCMCSSHHVLKTNQARAKRWK